MKKVLLLILDGWGIGKKDNSDAIDMANTPFVDGLYRDYPSSMLKTFGESVGLPEGQMGNSEVGHMNIGAGRVVWQMLVRINKAFRNNQVAGLEPFQNLFDLANENSSRKIHLMGLTSNGGVHSSLEHLKGLLSIFKENALDDRVRIHAFTDGRDTDPKSGIHFLREIETFENKGSAKIATVIGRYYAMDRDKRWDRTALAYNLLVNGEGSIYGNAIEALEESYAHDVTDEFLKPIVLDEDAQIKNGDIVLCFNFRTDRCRQISQALTQRDFEEENLTKLDVHYFTMTEYDRGFTNVNILFDNQDLNHTLGEELAKHGKKQLRAAETEKYPHVTFFFNGGREVPFENEERFLVNSPKVATYDLQPEMSAPELTAGIIERLDSQQFDFMCVNFANPDMVGHTGVVEAIIKACETVDDCTSKVVTKAKESGYSVVLIADHGNADKIINEDGSPNTAHTTNLVPCVVIDKEVKNISDGKLADIAPTILELLDLPQPPEMDGKSLIQ